MKHVFQLQAISTALITCMLLIAAAHAHEHQSFAQQEVAASRGPVDSVGSSTAAITPQNPIETATGVVYHDANANRVYDQGEELLSGVRVSNGRDVTTTDEAGRYQLPIDDDTILFVIKPRGWRTPLSETRLPEFYYIHKPNGSPASRFPGVAPTGPLPSSVDFPLYPQDEPETFKAIMFGDTQPRDQKEINYIAHDVVEELVGTDAAFGVTLGDIVFDNMSLYDSITRTVAMIGIPWYNVMGNHDTNQDAKIDKLSNETFESKFGPSYYSFDYGPTHFIVLDDIEWLTNPINGKSTYVGGIGPDQLEFVKNDLAGVPDERLVVLMMHIPIIGVRDRQDLYRLIEKRPFCMSISGHTHTHEHRFITREDGWQGPEPHHHVINATVCGSWWKGIPDERGIPHATMQDGTPNGYSIITFDGNKYSLRYKAASRPTDYQMQISAPEIVKSTEASDVTVYADVLNSSERSKVEMQVGDTGQWIPLKLEGNEDPAFRAAYELDQSIPQADKSWLVAGTPRPSTHVWTARLPEGLTPGTYLIRIRTTEYDGQKHTGQRVLRVE